MKTFLLISFFVAALAPTIAQAAPMEDGSEELSYDDLINQLSARKKHLQTRSVADPFDEVKVHAGMGLVNSFSTFQLAGHNVSRYQNGLQLAIGVDLFSDRWAAEAAYRNFGITTVGPEEHRLRELDLKFAYRQRFPEGPWGYRLQGGLAQRQLRLTDPTLGYDIDDTTPGLLIGMGLGLQMSPMMSMGFDFTGRAPVIGRTADKGALDFCIELKASL